MKRIKFKLCKAVLEWFKATREEWFLGRRMEQVKTIRLSEIADMCTLFGVDYWTMYLAIHQDYVIKSD